MVKNHNLHKPMYLFLCMLAVSELGMSLSTLPTVLGALVFGAWEVGLGACLSQLFFIPCSSIMDSGMLWALGCFIAIYKLLQRKLPFCGAHVLALPCCLHPNLIWLPCADTTLNGLYGLFVLLCTFGLDSLLTVLSSAMILKTILSISSREGHLKALSTCVSHISAGVLYYTPMIGLSMVCRSGRHASPLVRSLLAHIYLLLPLLLNPIIYGIKTREIPKALGKLFSPKREQQ
ncbi:hypothetical protein E2320_005717 [Naja naja]|nr:hypothetical protein E2320_005717 [Naja naja]